MELFVQYTVMVSVILLMLGVGMGTSFRRVVEAVRQFGVVVRGVLANFLVTPVLIYLILLSPPLPPDVKIGITLMAAAPVAPMAPMFVGDPRGDVAFWSRSWPPSWLSVLATGQRGQCEKYNHAETR